MQQFETIKVKGDLDIFVYDAEGNLKLQKRETNVVTTVGKQVIADRLGKSTPARAVMSHMAIGTSATAETAANTTLGAEVRRNQLGDPAGNANGTVVSGTTVTYQAVFGPEVAGTVSVVEAGIFNAASAGDMLCRTTFGVVTKENADTLLIRWTVTIV